MSYKRRWDPKKKKLICEHRTIMERYLGRYLLDYEVIHHKNGDKTDNHFSNLEVMSSSEHKRLHLLGKPRPCTQKHPQHTFFPEPYPELLGAKISLLPEYRTYELIECVVCKTLHWKRADKPTKTCSQTCAQKNAWEGGSYANRKKRAMVHVG